MNYMKFLYEVKSDVSKIRTDYYSTKTFYALKNSTEEDLSTITKVSKRMYLNIKNKFGTETNILE